MVESNNEQGSQAQQDGNIDPPSQHVDCEPAIARPSRGKPLEKNEDQNQRDTDPPALLHQKHDVPPQPLNHRHGRSIMLQNRHQVGMNLVGLWNQINTSDPPHQDRGQKKEDCLEIGPPTGSRVLIRRGCAHRIVLAYDKPQSDLSRGHVTTAVRPGAERRCLQRPVRSFSTFGFNLFHDFRSRNRKSVVRCHFQVMFALRRCAANGDIHLLAVGSLSRDRH